MTFADGRGQNHYSPDPGNGKGGCMRKVVAYMLVSVEGGAVAPDQFLFYLEVVMVANVGEVMATQDTNTSTPVVKSK